jgi:hypothetical protein
MIMGLPRLTHPTVDQQGRADMAIAIKTTLRAVITESARRIENTLAWFDVEYGT